MTIGEALKEEQIKLGLTGKEMAAGVVTNGTYSRVIHGTRRISSDLLIEILLMHDIDLPNFFDKVRDTYLPNSNRLEEKLSSQFSLAVNNHDVATAIKVFKQIKEAKVNNHFKKRAQIAIAFLTKDMDDIDDKFRESIIYDLTKNENWIFNVKALLLFATAIVILPADFVEDKMTLFFRKISRSANISEIMNERFATVCVNYLHWKHTQTKKTGGKSKNDKSNVINAIKYLKNLESTTHFIIYIISAEYYSALFSGNLTRAKQIKMNLLDMGCTLAVKNWPI
ncbi:helix-turn-helix domain-containing protein [Lactobacillus apis]|uniref:helix-turn-helix domain-containing protein n=1 Tax=Lactobacillus apis TaxID=303541 RepID=UPI002431AA87|nr:helix-turn-helix transcriptional regulator [Lactobacillus apis]